MRIMILTENLTTYSYMCDHSDRLQLYPYKNNLFSYLAGRGHTCPYTILGLSVTRYVSLTVFQFYPFSRCVPTRTQPTNLSN